MRRRLAPILVLALLGFTLEHVLRPIVPLIVVDRGGDVILVGAAAAAYAAPSVILRPVIGWLVDNWEQTRFLRLSAASLASTPIALLAPGIAALLIARVIQGAAWAVYSVSVQTLMARTAPPHRRGEASGYFQAMPAMAIVIGPAVGIWLYSRGGEVLPVFVASGLGVLASVVAVFHRRSQSPHRTPAARDIVSKFQVSSLLEPSALHATFMLGMFMSAHALYVVFPPIFVLSIDEPIEVLAIYYPIYGIVQVGSQLFGGRLSDRFGRRSAIQLGCGLAIIGLLVTIAGGGLLALVLGSSIYAVSLSVVGPALSALTIDRAPAERLGSAMATYSVGYQIGAGTSSLVWGYVVAMGGFSLAFLLAVGLQLSVLVSSRRICA